MTSSSSVISLANHHRFDTVVMGFATHLTRLPADLFLLASRFDHANPIGRLEFTKLNEMHPQHIRITGFKGLALPLQRSCINSRRRSLGAHSAFGKRWVSIADLGSSAGKTLSVGANGLRRWLGPRGRGRAHQVTTPGRLFENVGIQSARDVNANLLYPVLHPGCTAEGNA